jgi:opacity protein-like surface antigen
MGAKLSSVGRSVRTGPALAAIGLAISALFTTAPAARADVVFGANVGYFAIPGEGSRDSDDVIAQNVTFLNFNVGDFNGFTGGGEFLVGVGRFLEAGVGVGFYQKTVPSFYRDYVNSNGSEIEQDLKLRIYPVSFTARVYPTSRDAAVQPYVGGGLAILAWKYTETGQFVDFNNGNQVFSDTFTDSGNQVAPVFFGGLRFAVSDNVLIGGEFRWNGGTADLDQSLGFAGRRLDLSGYTTQATVQFRF